MHALEKEMATHSSILAWEFVGGSKLKDDVLIDIGVWLLALKSQYRGQVGGKKS